MYALRRSWSANKTQLKYPQMIFLHHMCVIRHFFSAAALILLCLHIHWCFAKRGRLFILRKKLWLENPDGIQLKKMHGNVRNIQETLDLTFFSISMSRFFFLNEKMTKLNEKSRWKLDESEFILTTWHI